MTDDLISRCFGRLPVAAFDRVEEKMMYESPITRFAEDIMTDIVEREEGYLVESVHKVGFDIDKEELAKALRYDRDQYEKGFNDGRLSASPRWIPVTERLPEKHTTVIVSCVDNSGDTSFSYTACGYWVGLLPDDDPAWIVDGEVNYHVVAWMPRPKPWKEGAE